MSVAAGNKNHLIRLIAVVLTGFWPVCPAWFWH
ncbi:Uncharacterised protein [Klebsiella pneumoniae]|nr:Uncharacterised protein [Klebsiella pneumoniae]